MPAERRSIGPLTLTANAGTALPKSLSANIQLSPDDPEAHDELGHYYDALMSDRDRAEAFYRLALARGAGAACRQALDELLAEPAGRGRCQTNSGASAAVPE
jgi:hypothetical protein